MNASLMTSRFGGKGYEKLAQTSWAPYFIIGRYGAGTLQAIKFKGAGPKQWPIVGGSSLLFLPAAPLSLFRTLEVLYELTWHKDRRLALCDASGTTEEQVHSHKQLSC